MITVPGSLRCDSFLCGKDSGIVTHVACFPAGRLPLAMRLAKLPVDVQMLAKFVVGEMSPEVRAEFWRLSIAAFPRPLTLVQCIGNPSVLRGYRFPAGHVGKDPANKTPPPEIDLELVSVRGDAGVKYELLTDPRGCCLESGAASARLQPTARSKQATASWSREQAAHLLHFLKVDVKALQGRVCQSNGSVTLCVGGWIKHYVPLVLLTSPAEHEKCVLSALTLLERSKEVEISKVGRNFLEWWVTVQVGHAPASSATGGTASTSSGGSAGSSAAAATSASTDDDRQKKRRRM